MRSMEIDPGFPRASAAGGMRQPMCHDGRAPYVAIENPTRLAARAGDVNPRNANTSRSARRREDQSHTAATSSQLPTTRDNIPKSLRFARVGSSLGGPRAICQLAMARTRWRSG